MGNTKWSWLYSDKANSKLIDYLRISPSSNGGSYSEVAGGRDQVFMNKGI